MKATVKTGIGRNDKGRLRVTRMEVEIDPALAAAGLERAALCAALFEDFCTVTAAVREGIKVDVRVAGFEKKEV
jgi:organic hydroperoxide reductase OsmC/OhrA